MIKSARMRRLFSAPYVSWAVIFIVVPLLMIFYYGFTDRAGHITLHNIGAILDPMYLKALGLSMLLSFISTLLCLVIAYPLCLILTKNKDSAAARTGVVIILFILPMWMNTLLRTIAWQTILEKTGVLNTILGALGLPALNLINRPHAIVLGMVYNFLPYMILPLFNALSNIDESVVQAAYDLGANKFQTFLRVILPLSVPGIISGITMVFIPALTTFVISQLLGGNKILLIGNVIEQQFTAAYNWNLGSGLSIVLMIFIIINMVITSIFDKEEDK